MDSDLTFYRCRVICAYLCVAMVRTNWYLATVQSQLEWYTTESLADTLTRGT